MKNKNYNYQPRNMMIMKNKYIKHISIYLFSLGLASAPVTAAVVTDNGSSTYSSCPTALPYESGIHHPHLHLHYPLTTCYPREGWYIGVGGGLAWHNHENYKENWNSNNLNQAANVQLRYDVGGEGFLSVGYIYNCWRFEIEGAYRYNSLHKSSISLNNGPTFVSNNHSGHIRDITLMANLFYDFYLSDCAGIYLGVGAGIDFNHIKARFVNNDPDVNLDISRKKSNELFAWQLMPGFFYNVNDRVTFDLGYRFFSTTKNKFDRNTSQKIAIAHNVEAKVRIRI